MKKQKAMKIRSWFLAAFCTFCLSWYGCGSYSSMQTARTVERGSGEVGLNLFLPYGIIDAIAQTADKDRTNFTVPYLQLTGKVGITEKMDVGLSLSTFGQLGLEAKYQILGDQESLFALAAGGAINTFFFTYYDFQLPVHASVHPVENLGIYITPKYIGQFVSNFGLASTYFDYTGLSTGVVYGDKVKVGGEITMAFPLGKFYRVDVFPNLYNFGVGVKWRLGSGKEKKENFRF